jgi:N6-L-threonylcarbamoyladenine synthase
VASLLGLSYPGGPSIEKAAKEGDPDAIRFPRSYLGKRSFRFSFSGLKTAVLYYLKGQDGRRTTEDQRPYNMHDVAASFQEAAVDVLVKKLIMAAQVKGVHRIGSGGGVAANTRLREKLHEEGEAKGLEVFFPSRMLCTDNAAMIAGVGYFSIRRGLEEGIDLRWDFDAHPR